MEEFTIIKTIKEIFINRQSAKLDKIPKGPDMHHCPLCRRCMFLERKAIHEEFCDGS